MDVSIRDMETESVTDISIIEIFHRLLSRLCCKGCQMAHNGPKKCHSSSSFTFSHLGIICFSYLSLSFLHGRVPGRLYLLFLVLVWGLCRTNRQYWYKSLQSTLQCNTCHSQRGEVDIWDAMDKPQHWGLEWLHNVFSIQGGEQKKIRMEKRWGAEIDKGQHVKRVREMKP